MTDASGGVPLSQALPDPLAVDWCIVPLSQATDAAVHMARMDSSLGARTGDLTAMTARDPRGVGVRGGYPQIQTGLPGINLLYFLRIAYRRAAAARFLVDRFSGELWGSWVDLVTEDEDLKRRLEQWFRNPLNRSLGRPMWYYLKQAERIARRDGRSLLYFGLVDDNADDPSLEPANVRGVRWLTVLREDDIHDKRIDDDPTSPGFGQVKTWIVRIPNAKGGFDYREVHSKRVLPIIPMPKEDDEWEGESILALNLNYVEGLENLLWATVEAYFQEAAPYVVVTRDPNVSMQPRDEDAVKSEVAKMQQSLVQRIFVKGVTVSLLAGSAQLADPTPHWDIGLQAFSMATGAPKSSIVGDSAGELASAQEDSRRFQRVIQEQKDNHADPILNALIDLLLEWGIESWKLPGERRVDFKWADNQRGDPNQEANRLFTLAQARRQYQDGRLPLDAELEYETVEWPDGRQEPPAAGGVGALPTSFLDEAIAPRGLAGLINRVTKRLHESLRDAFERAARLADPGGLRADSVEQDVAAVITAPQVRDQVAEAIVEMWRDALQTGGDQAVAGVDVDATYQALTSPSLANIQTLARRQAEDTLERLSDSVRRLVAENLARGVVGRELGQVIMDAYDATRVDAERIARSEGIYAYNQGALEGMQSAGVREYVWDALANPDPICAALDGRRFPVGGGPVPVRDTHPNCRCALLAVVE